MMEFISQMINGTTLQSKPITQQIQDYNISTPEYGSNLINTHPYKLPQFSSMQALQQCMSLYLHQMSQLQQVISFR